MNFTTIASSNSFNYAKIFQKKPHSQQKDVVTTHPDARKLIVARNVPNEIPDRKNQKETINLTDTLRYFC